MSKLSMKVLVMTVFVLAPIMVIYMYVRAMEGDEHCKEIYPLLRKFLIGYSTYYLILFSAIIIWSVLYLHRRH